MPETTIQLPAWIIILWTIATFLIPIIVSIYTSRKFGDVAGTQASIKYEKEKEARALPVQLRILKSICETAKDVHNLYSSPLGKNNPSPPQQFPTEIFEKSILSTDSPLYSGNYIKIISAIEEYLYRVRLINPYIEWRYEQDTYSNMGPGDMQSTIHLRELPSLARNRVTKILNQTNQMIPIHDLINIIELEIDKILSPFSDT